MAFASSESGRQDGHAGRRGFPDEINLRGYEGVRLVDEVAEPALQGQDFRGDGSGWLDGAGILLPQPVKACRGQRLLLAPDALHFADPGVGIKLGWGEKLGRRLFHRVFHLQPADQRA